MNEKNKITILKAKDVARILGINVNAANELFKRKDFPSLNNAGDNKIEETAFFNWLQMRHADDEETEM